MSEAALNSVRWTSADLELLQADEWKRYEIIDGELFVTRAPHIGHQAAAGRIYARLLLWSEETGLGQPFMTPGIIFTDTDNVIPDVVWVSQARLAAIVDQEGHLTGAPELVVEVLSPGSVRVQEYWIVDWRLRQVEVYCRQEAQLQAISTLLAADEVTSPLLPGFQCKIEPFF